jgi:hypothetical protein
MRGWQGQGYELVSMRTLLAGWSLRGCRPAR